jgi:phosphatidylserine/phosphatidylglycerophosphate/cardiolipin synthase-like enzyme
MRVLVVVFIILTNSLVQAQEPDAGVPEPTNQCSAQVLDHCFSPKGGCTQMVIKAINSAHTEVRLMGYYITSRPIVMALIRAHERGLLVVVIADKSQQRIKNPLLELMRQNSIQVLIDSAHAIMHDKIVVIDSVEVLEGSFNFTNAAERNNAENMLVLQSPCLAKWYVENFYIHKDHSDAYGHPTDVE